MKLFFNSNALKKKMNEDDIKLFEDDISVIDVNSPWPIDAIPAKSILLVESYTSKDVINLAVEKKVNHIVQINRGCLDREIRLAAKMISTQEEFIANPFQFIFKGVYQPIFKCKVSSSRQKASVKEAISKSFEKNRLLDPLVEPVLVIADELIMNSIFDAPQNTVGQFIHSKASRSAEIFLSESESSDVVIAHDDHYLAIMCSDPFGSLNTTQLLLRLQQCYTAAGNVMNLGAGGAGVGCQMMFDRSGGFCIGVKRGVRTIFCCLLPIKYRNLAPQLNSKNLHLVEIM